MVLGRSNLSKMLRVLVVSGLVVAGSWLLPSPCCGAEKKAQKAGKESVPPKVEAAISQAVMAYHLAIQGQRTKSPILMLAASELVGVLKTKEPPPGLKKELSEGKKPSGAPVSFDVVDWQEKAREYAKGDKELLALVENRIEKMSSRGIINLPPGSYTKYFGGTRYTVLEAGVLNPGESTTLGGLIVRGGEFAALGVAGDVDSEFVVKAIDEDGSEYGGRSFRGIGIYSWTPKKTHRASVRVTNVGKIAPYCIIGH